MVCVSHSPADQPVVWEEVQEEYKFFKKEYSRGKIATVKGLRFRAGIICRAQSRNVSSTDLGSGYRMASKYIFGKRVR